MKKKIICNQFLYLSKKMEKNNVILSNTFYKYNIMFDISTYSYEEKHLACLLLQYLRRYFNISYIKNNEFFETDSCKK